MARPASRGEENGSCAIPATRAGPEQQRRQQSCAPEGDDDSCVEESRLIRISANLSRRRMPVIPPVMPTYGRWDVAAERGEGCYLYATDGRKFLDFTSGIAVTSLGHCHPHVVEAVTEQARKTLARLEPVPASRGSSVWPSGSSPTPSPTPYSSTIRAPRPSSCRSRSRASTSRISAIPERYRVIGCHGLVPRPQLRDLGRGRRRGLPQGVRPARWKASTTSPSTI